MSIRSGRPKECKQENKQCRAFEVHFCQMSTLFGQLIKYCCLRGTLLPAKKWKVSVRDHRPNIKVATRAAHIDPLCAPALFFASLATIDYKVQCFFLAVLRPVCADQTLLATSKKIVINWRMLSGSRERRTGCANAQTLLSLQCTVSATNYDRFLLLLLPYELFTGALSALNQASRQSHLLCCSLLFALSFLPAFFAL